jgi:CHAT domain-containing protein
MPESRCGDALTVSEDYCGLIIDTHELAVEALVTRPMCTDSALSLLRTLAQSEVAIQSDVAAAYYVRAQRDNRPSDLLLAYDAADRAVRASTSNSAAQFNLALIQETIGLKSEALASWESIAGDRSDWGREAREHLERLRREVARDPTAQWARHLLHLHAAMRLRDASAVKRLIDDYPKAALTYLEDEALLGNDLPGARVLAAQLSIRLGGDRYPIDVADAAARNREGHVAMRDGRVHAASFQPADVDYARASVSLKAGGSPLYLEAEIGRARGLALSQNDEGAQLLASIERDARAKNYTYILAHIQSAQGFIRFLQSRYLESLTHYEGARSIYARLRDAENLASVQRSIASDYRDTGQKEIAWREALGALPFAPLAAELRIRHSVSGELAGAAHALGHSRVAVLYEDAVIRMIQQHMAAIAPERTEAIGDVLSTQLSIALRQRAQYEIGVGDDVSADRDLQEAIRIGRRDDQAASTQRLLKSRIHETEGRTLLTINPSRAAAAFREALSLVDVDELHTYRALLLSQLADAERNAGREKVAQLISVETLAELKKEERKVLDTRRRGEGEAIWSRYFSRSEPTYERIIEQLIRVGNVNDAFAYAERKRAYEPLDLILRSTTAPKRFRELTRGGEPIALDAIQRELPPGTFLLLYSVAADHTSVWVVSRDATRFVDQELRREDVVRWSDVLQRAGRRRDRETFERNLNAPYEKLIAPSLKAIAAMNGGRPASRLVIVPDGPMHGLPLAALQDSISHKYLFQYAPLEIAGSATLYIFSLLRDAELPASGRSVLLVGDSAFDTQATLAHGLPRLPDAIREVNAIRVFYEPSVEVRTGKEATFADFIARARDKSIVHIAGHAIVNPEEPSRSLLLLAQSPDRPSGAVEAQELLSSLSLARTRLFVLSACSSAGGFPVGSEGVGPLVRPLIAAGVPAVVGSLWDVEDATAKELFVSFHHRYSKGSDAAAALQAAQLQLLESDRADRKSVFAWAPFQVIGHASSPFGPAQ